VGIFSKKPKAARPCPICGDDLNQVDNKYSHWHSHVTEIPQGQGDASGQFTFNCSCGPAGMKWPKPGGATAGLAMHMEQRHGIAL